MRVNQTGANQAKSNPDESDTTGLFPEVEERAELFGQGRKRRTNGSLQVAGSRKLNGCRQWSWLES